MVGPTDLARMVPGFEFLQNLMKGAGAGLPSMGQWIAPTLDPKELDKRIQDLKTVQFWLEQNARLLATTVQAMEVQRMTLSTLQSMNLPLADIGNALKLRPAAADGAAPAVPPSWPMPPAAPSPSPFSSPPPPEASATRSPPAAEPAERPARAASRRAAGRPPAPAATTAAPSPGAVDPMQWWGALTQQFAQLAAQAVKDTAEGGARTLAGAVAQTGQAMGIRRRAEGSPAPAAPRAPAATAAKTRATPARPVRGRSR